MKVFVSIILYLLNFYCLNGQQSGDYRTIASGNWTNTAIWQTYNGTNWVAATNYPGQTIGTNDVFILGGNSVSISSTILNTINSLTVGDGLGLLDNFYVSGTSSLNTQQITIANGGFVEWTSNVSLSLPSGASFNINSGGVLSTDNPCSASKRLIIGAVIYSTCNGGSRAQYSFSDLNDNGGSLSVTPSSNDPICNGQILNLYANPSGTGSSNASFLWTGSNGYSSTSPNTYISGLNPGNYTFTVTISDTSGNTNTKSISVTVFNTPVITATTPGSRNGQGTVILGATASSGVITWFSSVSGGSALGNGTSFTTPTISATTTFYVQTFENSCSSDRVPVIATINPSPTVISNRNITYRVNNN